MTSTIKINHITIRGKSTLNVLSDICAICRENICDKCIKCNQTQTNDECISIVGVCNHAYHRCCIQRLMNGLASISQKCPLCNQKWELKKRLGYGQQPKIEHIITEPVPNPIMVIEYDDIPEPVPNTVINTDETDETESDSETESDDD